MRDYSKATARARAHEIGAHADEDAAAKAEESARMAELVRIEQSAAGYAVILPGFDGKSREQWAVIRHVKSIPGRRFDGASKVWTIPADQAEEVETMAASYGVDITPATDPRDQEIMRLRRELEQRDQYIAGLEAQLGMGEGPARHGGGSGMMQHADTARSAALMPERRALDTAPVVRLKHSSSDGGVRTMQRS